MCGPTWCQNDLNHGPSLTDSRLRHSLLSHSRLDLGLAQSHGVETTWRRNHGLPECKTIAIKGHRNQRPSRSETITITGHHNHRPSRPLASSIKDQIGQRPWPAGLIKTIADPFNHRNMIQYRGLKRLRMEIAAQFRPVSLRPRPALRGRRGSRAATRIAHGPAAPPGYPQVCR